MKYCFEVEKIIKKTTLVMVEADSYGEAQDLIYEACENQDIDFEEVEDEEEEFDYSICSDSAREDYTFDDSQFSDIGIKYLN